MGCVFQTSFLLGMCLLRVPDAHGMHKVSESWRVGQGSNLKNHLSLPDSGGLRLLLKIAVLLKS